MVELAQRYGVPLSPEFDVAVIQSVVSEWPAHLVSAGERLDQESCNRLATVLGPFTGNQLCYFRSEPLLHDRDHTAVYRCLLGDAPAALAGAMAAHGAEWGRYPPTVWWPEDHSRCVVTPAHSGLTLVGGSAELIAALLAEPYLDGIAVEAAARVNGPFRWWRERQG